MNGIEILNYFNRKYANNGVKFENTGTAIKIINAEGKSICLRIALYFGTEEYDTSFLYDDSMRGIKESAIDITFERYFKEGINYEKLKKMINELSDNELDKRNFIEFIEKQALLNS